MALGVASRARIAIPVPRAADPSACFQHLHVNPQPVAQAQELLQTSKAGTNDEGIKMLGLGL